MPEEAFVRQRLAAIPDGKVVASSLLDVAVKEPSGGIEALCHVESGHSIVWNDAAHARRPSDTRQPSKVSARDRVAVVDATPEDEPYLERLRDQLATQLAFGAPDVDEIVERSGDASVLATLYTYTNVSREVFERLPELRLVATRTAGYTHIDTEAAEDFGVAVAIVPGASTPSVAEYTLGCMLALARNLSPAWASTRSGEWAFTEFGGVELRGKTLGVVGLGSTGTRIAELGNAIGMEVLGWSREMKNLPGVQQVPLDELLRRADVVSLNVPLVDETRRFLSAERLRLMKPTAYLVNPARGGIVDEDALCRALERGELAGAVLDVLETEPPSPERLEQLQAVPNLLLTPHIAWHTDETLRRQFDGMIDNIFDFVAGKPMNLVTAGPARSNG